MSFCTECFSSWGASLHGIAPRRSCSTTYAPRVPSAVGIACVVADAMSVSEEAKALVRAKAAVEKLVYNTQLELMEGAVTEQLLREAAQMLQPQQYSEVIEERATEGLCGFPLCDKAAPNRGEGPAVHFSLSQKKVRYASAAPPRLLGRLRRERATRLAGVRRVHQAQLLLPRVRDALARLRSRPPHRISLVAEGGFGTLVSRGSRRRAAAKRRCSSGLGRRLGRKRERRDRLWQHGVSIGRRDAGRAGRVGPAARGCTASRRGE